MLHTSYAQKTLGYAWCRKISSLSKPVKLIGRKMVLKRLSAHGVFCTMMCIPMVINSYIWCVLSC